MDRLEFEYRVGRGHERRNPERNQGCGDSTCCLDGQALPRSVYL